MIVLNFCRPKTETITKTKKDRAEFMREYNRKYREAHSGIVLCECGAEYKEISKYNHYGSQRHQSYIRMEKAD